MKCPKCGNQMDKNICNECGYKNKLTNHEQLVNKHKNNNNTLLVLAFCCIIVFFLIMGLGFKSIRDYEVKNYIKLGNEQLPTIYNVIGKKEINNIYKTKTGEKIIYALKGFSDDDLYNYIQKLYDLNYVDSKTKDGIQLIKEPDEKGKLILVNIESTGSNIYFEYSYKNGKLSDYEVSGNITIGNDESGYLSIPGSFSKTIDENNILQYESNKEYVKLASIKQETSINSYSKAMLAEYRSKGLLCNIEEITVYGNEGYLLESIDKSDNTIIKTWVFKSKDNKFYTIEIKSNNAKSNIFYVIYTYQLEKE